LGIEILNNDLGVPLRVGLSTTSPRSCGLYASIPNAKYTDGLQLSAKNCKKGGRGLAVRDASIDYSGKQGARVAPNKNRPHPTLS